MPHRLLNPLYDKLLSRFGLWLLALALLVNIGALLMVDREVGKLDQARAMTLQSRNVMAEVLRIQSMLYESESAQRTFLYTDNREYLQPLNDNDGLVTSGLARLRGLIADNLPQREIVDLLSKIAVEKVAEMNKAIAIQQMGQKEAARACGERSGQEAYGGI